MTCSFRVRDYSCVHAETYKYYLQPETVQRVWRALAESFGTLQHGEVLPTIEIHGEHLWLRAASTGNPVTVIRKRGFRHADIARLHAILGFSAGVDDVR